MRRISVVIPARNEARRIGAAVAAVRRQAQAGTEIEVVVVDDGSSDGTPDAARRAGARVLHVQRPAPGGNPAAARNLGAAASAGDPIVFLDADCEPAPGWLEALLAAHEAGAAIVGGSLELPPRLPPLARCDYYAGWYHVHPRRPGGEVPNHPPGNLSVRRDVFLATRGFEETGGFAYGHEELQWQADARRAGHPIVFEPKAMALHHNRPGLVNLIGRSWRWGSNAIEAKSKTGAARWAGVYRHPIAASIAAVPLAPAQAAYVLACWVRAGRLEALLFGPLILLTRLVHSIATMAGGLRWALRARHEPALVLDALSGSGFGDRVETPPRLTAAVCTRNRPDELQRALRSLTCLSPAADEILVVDNAPADDRTRAVSAAFPQARYALEPIPGLDVARNRALREASTDLVAFLDDDAVADSGWAEAFRQAFAAAPALGACTGRVEALSLDHPGQRLFEANGGYARGRQSILLPRDARRPLHGLPAPLMAWAASVGNGSSLAVRRDLVLGLGGFDERLDRGPELPGGGDLDILWRVLQAGRDVLYEPRALAWHDHRHREDEAVAQIVGHQRAFIACILNAARTSSGSRRVGTFTFLVWRLFKPGVRLVRRAARRDPLTARALLRMWRACWHGLRTPLREPREVRAAPSPAAPLPC